MTLVEVPITHAETAQTWTSPGTLVPLIVSMVALLGSLLAVLISHWMSHRDEMSRQAKDREHEHARWVRDQKAGIYSTLVALLSDHHREFSTLIAPFASDDRTRQADEALIIMGNEHRRLRASVRLLGASEVVAALGAHWHHLQRSLTFVHRLDENGNPPDVPVHEIRDITREDRRLVDAAIDAMQRDLGIGAVTSPPRERKDRTGE